MERKTIGGFLAALRKANGMTQKDLAEKLNVSDKTVSRWERDEGAPDLSLIPVIAEIFNITCDELLRGERNRADDAVAEVTTPKAEKQRQRLLAVSLSRYRLKTFISMGIAIVGLIVAMIGNLGFLRAYIGFFVSTIFYLGSAVCQAISLNSAFLSVADESLPGEEIGHFKYAAIQLAQYSFGLTIVLFGGSLPLVVFPHDTYAGISAGSWLEYGLIYGAAALLLCAVVCYFLNASMLKRGVFCLKKEQNYWYNHRLKRVFALAATALLTLTFCIYLFVFNTWDATALVDGTVFYDYESFVEFMETERAYEQVTGSIAEEPVSYYDQYGDELSEDEARRETLYTYGNSPEGTAVCTFIWRNNSVSRIKFQEKDGSLLPITVYTYQDMIIGQSRVRVINTVFLAIYCMEILAAVLFYFKKRAKA